MMRGHKPAIRPGERFGLLTVLAQGPTIGPDSSTQRTLVCRCDCGAEVTARASAVFNGKQVSCGCVRRMKARMRLCKHGALSAGHLPPSYRSWRDMRARCLRPRHPQFKNYGGRGIGICPRWLDYANFAADMGEPPISSTLERIDVNLGYSPENCRWATKQEQTLNKRTTVRLTFRGRTWR